MSKIEFELECFSDEFVVCKLFAMIGGQGMYLVLDRQQELADLLANGSCRSPRHFSEQGETRFSFGQCHHRMFLLFAEECVHFPVTQAFSGVRAG